MIEKTLTLSTAHMPCNEPDFGDLRYESHEFGYIVFFCTFSSKTPDWLRTITEYCSATNCTLINFDCDADIVPQFQAYDW